MKYDHDMVRCPSCGTHLPLAELLRQLPGETEAEYGGRLRREWKRETTRPRRRRTEPDDYDDICAVLGV